MQWAKKGAQRKEGTNNLSELPKVRPLKNQCQEDPVATEILQSLENATGHHSKVYRLPTFSTQTKGKGIKVA